MERLDPNFADFLRSLNSHGVEYLVVGGYAVGFHGFVRATGDLDVFVGVSPSNAAGLVAAFHAFGLDLPEVSAELFLKPGKVFRIGVPPLRLDVINRISGVDFASCYATRVETDIDGLRVPFIDREHLLLNKAASGRPKDLADLHALRHHRPA
jgi:predicted nucleotidyltransferase